MKRERKYQWTYLVSNPISRIPFPRGHHKNGWIMIFSDKSNSVNHWKITKTCPSFSPTSLPCGVSWTLSITRKRRIWTPLKPILRAICCSLTWPKFCRSWEFLVSDTNLNTTMVHNSTRTGARYLASKVMSEITSSKLRQEKVNQWHSPLSAWSSLLMVSKSSAPATASTWVWETTRVSNQCSLLWVSKIW